MATPARLSRDQARVFRDIVRRQEAFGISAISLLEIATLSRGTRGVSASDVFAGFRDNPIVQVIPFTLDMASEVAALGNRLNDPGDRAIVATARVLGMRLLTSDQAIIESGLVPVVC